MLNATILLVEDDENDALFLLAALKKTQVKNPLHVVTDGRDAIAYLDGTGKYSDRAHYPVPYLVLLDLKLPQVMGLEVLKHLRQRAELDSTIVIVLTASQDPQDIEKAYHLRANAYLVKPSGLDSLLLLVQSIKDFWLTQNQPATVFSPDV
ncbi:MAG TPA: response regulator [Clostridia bacterium]|nr:response regulator [Clostridia bacterium]